MDLPERSIGRHSLRWHNSQLFWTGPREVFRPGHFLEPGGQLNDLYLIVHSVQGLKPGAYFFHRGQNTLELLKEGEFRAEAYHLGLEQELPADACVDVFFLADLNRILERYGNRGYRAVQLEAGAIGGRMYLAAYAQRLAVRPD